MKKSNMSRLVCMLLIVVSVTAPFLSIGAQAAETRASLYLSSYDVWVSKQSSGKLLIEYSVLGTGTMDEIGLKSITVQKKSGSTWVNCYTIDTSSHPSILAKNTYSHGGSVTYTGTPGVEYRVVATVYAGKNGSGDSRYFTTNSVVI